MGKEPDMDEVTGKLQVAQEVPSGQSAGKKYLRIFLRVILWTAIGFFGSTLIVVILYSFVNPPVTPLMISRAFLRKSDGRRVGIHKDWVSQECFAAYDQGCCGF
jgi:hypothetical protein